MIVDPAGRPSYVAAFRAYRWNADIASLAERFFSNCTDARRVVLLNEEHGEIDVGPWEKVAHGKDFDELGLPERPVGRSPWHNSDYVFAFLGRRLPDYDYYLIVESDIAFNVTGDSVVRYAVRKGADAVLHHITPVHPEWLHYEAATVQPDPLRSFVFASLFSKRALESLLSARLTLARHPEFAVRPWPICESFIPTALRDAGLQMAELSGVCDTTRLRYRPFLSLRDPHVTRPGTVAHPVLGTGDLVRSLLYDQPAFDYFRPGSTMHGFLSAEPLDVVAPALIEGFIRQLDHRSVARMHGELTKAGLRFPHHSDLAYGKPALISSVSDWSRGSDPELDAAGANGFVFHDVNGFHTDSEPSAWWQVDLLEECVIDRVEIVNRVTMSERFVRFVVESSRDGRHWSVRHLKYEDDPVSSDASAPWSIDLPDPFLARFVRVRRLGDPDCLHLRRVRLFGRVLSAPEARSP